MVFLSNERRTIKQYGRTYAEDLKDRQIISLFHHYGVLGEGF